VLRNIGGSAGTLILESSGVRTRFLYSDPSSAVALLNGRTHWAFSRGATVVDSDWSGRYDQRDLWSTVQRAVESFGDDADLEIAVRRAPAAPDCTCTRAFASDDVVVRHFDCRCPCLPPMTPHRRAISKDAGLPDAARQTSKPLR
jgi:hypothetical protein